MRVMVIVKADEDSEAGVLPSTKQLADMGAYNDQLVKAGVMLAGEGLQTSSRGKRVRFEGKQRKVIDGPFAETKELIAGFWLWQVKSMDEAVEWLKRAPFDGGTEVEIRQVFEAEDFGEEYTPELREQEARQRAGSTRRRTNGRERRLPPVEPGTEAYRVITEATRLDGDSQGSGHRGERSVERPQVNVVEQSGREQVCVHPADPAAPQRRPLDEANHFVVRSHARGVQLAQPLEHLGPRGDRTEGDLAEYAGVHHDATLAEQLRQTRVAPPPVIEPHRRVGEDHHRPRRRAPGRRRGIAFRRGMVPPRAARRRPASRAMRASSPARTRAVFSSMPVSARASSSNASSIMSVVRICIYMCMVYMHRQQAVNPRGACA